VSQYSDMGLSASTTYYYKVTAVDVGLNESAPSNEASDTTPDETPPAAPTNLSATAISDSQIDLDWDDNTEPDLDGYNVYRDTAPGVPVDLAYRIATGVATSEYSDTGLAAETTYYYVVTAVDTSTNESGASNEASATTQAGGDVTPPAAPTNLTADAVSSTQIDLDWDDNTEPDLASYNVYRSTTNRFTPGPENLYATGVLESAYSDTGCSPSTRYYYRVTAVDTSDNESEPSDQASARTPK